MTVYISIEFKYMHEKDRDQIWYRASSGKEGKEKGWWDLRSVKSS